MDEPGGVPPDAPLKRRTRMVGRFPRIHVRSRAEMGRALRRWRPLLTKYAEAELGPGEAATEAVRTTSVKLLSIEEPDFPHVLDVMMATLRNQCRSIKQRLAHEATEAERRKTGPLFDPRLGALTGAIAEAVEHLPAAEHEVLLFVAQGVQPAEIALLTGRASSTVRVLLARARAHVRAELDRNGDHPDGGDVPALLVGWWGALRTVRRGGQDVVHGVTRLGHSWATSGRAALARSTEALSRVAASPQVTATAVLLAAVGTAAPLTGGNNEMHAARPPMAMASQPPSRMTNVPQIASTLPGRVVRAVVISDSPLRPAMPGSIPAPGRGAAAETPEDVRVTTAATPPRAPGTGPPAIVAVGTGQTCQCQVLLQSLDGGVTWSTPRDGPLVVLNQLVLPPAYPADPRIFGSNGDAEAGVPPFEAASFGATFQPLALPAGRIAVSADFDAGDPRLFVANTTGVWSLDVDAAPPATPRLEIETGSTTTPDGVVAALATPPARPGGPALLVWAPNLATVPGSLSSPHLNPTLMACPTTGRCATRSDVPGLPQFLTVGADTPDTVVAWAWSSTLVFVSRDGGRSFTSVAVPSPGGLAFSMVVMGAGGQVWGSFTGADGEVARLSDAGKWITTTGGDPLLRSRTGALIAVDSSRIIDALEGAGYRCTSVNGVTAWAPRCPR